jgi:hypothetical protein
MEGGTCVLIVIFLEAAEGLNPVLPLLLRPPDGGLSEVCLKEGFREGLAFGRVEDVDATVETLLVGVREGRE